MMDFRNYDFKEFSNEINENYNTISDLAYACRSMSYTNKPFENVTARVNKSNIKDENKEVVSKFIYFNLYNRTK
jgi:hypothetical protein